MHAVARARPRGFTLVEVLVALLVMAVLAGLSWRGLDGIVRTRDAIRERMEQTLRMNTVLGQWEQDLLAVQDNPLVPALSFDGATVRMVRRTDTGLQVVAWSLREGKWLRWAAPAVTRATALQENWLRSQQLLGNEPQQLVVAEGVQGWQVYFFRGNAWTNAQSSGDLAPVEPPEIPEAPETPGSGPAPGAGPQRPPPGTRPPPRQQRQLLPSGVRLAVAFEGRITGTLTRDIVLAPQLPP